MKITYKDYRGKSCDMELGEAIKNACYSNPYSYVGQLKRVNAQVDLLGEVFARSIEMVFDKEKSDEEKLEYILGHGFKVSKR